MDIAWIETILNWLKKLIKKKCGILSIIVFVIPFAITIVVFYLFCSNWTLAIIFGLIAAWFFGIITYCADYWKCKIGKKKKHKKELEKLADDALKFLYLLDDNHLKFAIGLIGYPLVSEKSKYERIVEFAHLQYHNFDQMSFCTDDNQRYIWEGPSLKGCGQKVRILFNPIFYVLLENFIKTQKKEFSQDFNIMTFDNDNCWNLFAQSSLHIAQLIKSTNWY